jgi:hypothetical protein
LLLVTTVATELATMSEVTLFTDPTEPAVSEDTACALVMRETVTTLLMPNAPGLLLIVVFVLSNGVVDSAVPLVVRQPPVHV